jgi:pyruvate dehydrogenase E2 component (dihydrolipoamide acetyltransferase)
MPIDLLMPQLSPTMTEGRLAKWLRQPGDAIKAGDVVAEVETDKATMEVEASEDGIIHKFIVDIGTDLPVGTPIAILAKKGETVPADYQPKGKVAPKAEAAPAVAPVAAAPVAMAAVPAPVVVMAPVLPVVTTTNHQPSTAHGRVIASPLAKRLADQQGLDLSRIQGSGPRGRVVAKDLQNVVLRPSTIDHRMTRKPDIVEKLTPMRKAIAARLTQSKQTVPHFYLKVRADMATALDFRKQLNAHYEAKGEKVKVSVNDLIIKASGLALAQYPAANAAWNPGSGAGAGSDSVVQFGNVDISVAVSIDGGLITPIVTNADQKSLASISTEMKALAAAARANQLKPEQYTGGSFSISNLGMYGIEEFAAIINPPQAAILAVGAADDMDRLALTLSVDHRVIDGALGAELLGAIRAHLENPVGLVL